ncbi:MAG: YfhO family protein, partial [Candidatus Binatia bacterium]
VYIASQAVHETQSARTLRILSSRDFDPRIQVLVSEEIPTAVNPAHGGEAQIVRYSNNRVVVEASLAGSGILVLTDSYYPGWKVFVDGKEERILRANHFFRGVRLLPGNHNVEFRYEPLSFTIGWAISLLTLILLTGISLVRVSIWRKRRHQVMCSLPLREPTTVEQ